MRNYFSLSTSLNGKAKSNKTKTFSHLNKQQIKVSNKVSKDEYFKPVVKEASPEILSREKLNKVLEYFENRKTKTDEILSTPLILPDPSL